MLKKRSAHNKYAGKSHLPVPGVFTRISHFKQIFVKKPIEDETDEEEDGLEESDDNCSDSGSEVSYSDLEDDDDDSETEIDGNS